MSGRIILTTLGRGWRFPEIGPLTTFWFWWCLRTVMAPLGVSFSLLIEDQSLVEVDLSAILGPLDSNWFMLYPWAMSFFQKLCPAPFLLVSKWHITPRRVVSVRWDGTWKAGNPALVITYMCIKSSHCMSKYIQLHLSVILKAPG